jgi:hypothetical protein
MALLYFPKSAYLGVRESFNPLYDQLTLATNPNMVFYFDSASAAVAASSSGLFITCSWAQSASVSQVFQVISSASWASQSLSASFASNAGGSGNSTTYVTITTSSTNWITASFSNGEQFVNITSPLSYSFTSSNAPASGTVASTTIYINNTATATSSLAFPNDWVFIGSFPTYITASRGAVLSIRNYGGTKTVASFAPQY